MDGFELISETKLNETIPVKKFRSTKTGLTVVLGDVEGPTVQGKFVVVTAASDNDGLPHTLEHLISLGSQEYPFKGVLDLVANRCLAGGTNAWTDDDHTCYTIECVGAEGFLQTLPVYLDHILYPLLTEEAFITEVHHITSEAKDGGVVYCEMQGSENSADNRKNLELMKNLYPNTGYAFEVGGLMKNLRESITNEKIRNFHKKFYCAENLTVVITGQIDQNEVFKAMEPIEKKILAKAEVFENPWKVFLEPLEETKLLTITYPDDEETHGIVVIGYRGPSIPSELSLYHACTILLRYLSYTTTSPLEQEMIQIDDPFASGVYCCTTKHIETLLEFQFRSVPLKKIDEIHDKYFQLLNKIGNGEEKIDMKRMKEVIEKEIVENVSGMEIYPHMSIASNVISHTVYGDDSDFDDWFNPNKFFAELIEKDEIFWIKLLKKYLTNKANYVFIKALPSIEEKKRLANEEQSRIEARNDELGLDGLIDKAKTLAEAKLVNDIPPPEAMITSIPIPNFDNIASHSVEIFCLNDFPFHAEAIDIHSNFVYVILSINTEHVPTRLRPYLRLFLSLLGQCPIKRGTEIIPYEEVVNQIEADLISKSNEIGLDDCGSFFCGDYSNHLFIAVNVEPKKYDLAAKWLDEMLNHTVFDKDRVRVTAMRMLNEVAEFKRDGYVIALAMIQAIVYKNTSNNAAISVLKQKKFLAKLLKDLDDPEKATEIINDFETLQKLLMQAQNVSLHIAANWKKMNINFVTPFKNFLETNDTVSKELKVIHDQNFIVPGGNLNDSTNGVILGLGTVESSYLFSVFPIDVNTTQEDIPALMLFAQYFIQVEGPFYNGIRGKGYAYGYDIDILVENGLLAFNLFMATNLLEAFQAAKTLVQQHCTGNTAWDANLLQSARTSFICKIVEREENIRKVVRQAILSTFKGVGVGYSKELMKKVQEVTEEDLNRVGEKFMSKLFGVEAFTAIVCHPDNTKNVQTGFDE